MRRFLLYVMTVAGVLASACSRPILPLMSIPSLSVGGSLSVGEWAGTTSQGTPIAFTVASDETVRAITLEYDFNGCSGSRTFSDLNVRTAPDLTCIPGPCTGVLPSYRAFSYADGSPGSGPRTQVNGLFLPGNQARGQAILDYPGCGTPTTVQWIATRRRY